MSKEASRVAAEMIESLGYQTLPAPRNKYLFSLWVYGTQTDRAARVGARISLFNQAIAGSRYQYDVRHHDKADIFLLIARNGQDWPFVIPAADIAPRRNIAVWSVCPDRYRGRWAEYLNAWDHLHQAIAGATTRPPQMPLFNSAASAAKRRN